MPMPRRHSAQGSTRTGRAELCVCVCAVRCVRGTSSVLCARSRALCAVSVIRALCVCGGRLGWSESRGLLHAPMRNYVYRLVTISLRLIILLSLPGPRVIISSPTTFSSVHCSVPPPVRGALCPCPCPCPCTCTCPCPRTVLLCPFLVTALVKQRGTRSRMRKEFCLMKVNTSHMDLVS